MAWLPIGPNFVFSPKNANFKRVSRRNSWGKGCEVQQLVLDPTDERTIYVVHRPNSGGASAFRTRNDGAWWDPIADDLQTERDPRIDPAAIAINPDHPEQIYMGTFFDRGVYISSRRGERGSWSAKHSIPGGVRFLVVDPRTSADLRTTVIYAATDTGVYISNDGGETFSTTPVLSGDVWTFSTYIPRTGSPQLYAAVYNVGVYYTNRPRRAEPWQLLSTGAPGMLPRYDPTAPMGNFEFACMDYSLQNPNRVYVWLVRNTMTVGLFTTDSPPGNWRTVPMAMPPGPLGVYAYAFAVAPNSPGDGDGSRDILLLGSETLWRSIDGGRRWQDDRGFMSDFHDIKFGPYRRGEIPNTYIGCDGGLGRSNLAADPRYTIPADHGSGNNGDYNEEDRLPNLGFWQNLNYGRHSTAPFFYGSDPSISALSYLSFQDTSFAAGNAALGWWDVGGGGDGFQIAAKQGPDGVRLWIHYNSFFGMITDVGRPQQGLGRGVTFGAGGPGVLATSANFVVDSTGNCIAGIKYTDGSMVEHRFVARVNMDGVATRVSPDFGGEVHWVAVHPSNPNIICCTLGWDQIAFSRRADRTDLPWTQFGFPSGITPVPQIVALDIDSAGRMMALVSPIVRIGMEPLSSPLFQVTDAGLALQECSFPSNFDSSPNLRFGRIVAHPINADVFFAAHAARVYKLTWAQNRWTWQDLSEGLPGQWVYDLWIGNVARSGAAPRFLLRAAVTTRSAYERDVTEGASTPGTALYLRDNFLDQWWQNPSPSNRANPYTPAEIGRWLYHYQCEDIKIDAQQQGMGSVPNFFQTDPETNPQTGRVDPLRPMTQVVFDQLKDNSYHLPSLDRAWVHVQVHNHSNTPANEVRVWVLFCRAAAGVANLNARRRMDIPYDFWSQFRPDGSIIPNLPEGSPWVAIGPIVTLHNITAGTPQVASWEWVVPALEPGDRGHHCMMAFVHSRASQLRETSTEVDIITPRNKQIGQKNLHIGPPLPARSGRGMSGATGGEMGSSSDGRMREYIEFHNSSAYTREATLVFDLRSLPPELWVTIQFSTLRTRAPLRESLTGIQRIVTRATGFPSESVSAEDSSRSGRNWLLEIIGAVSFLIGFLSTLLRGITPPSPEHSYAPIRTFEPEVFEADPSALVQVRDVQIGPFEFVAARFTVENRGELPQGEEYAFQVQQKVKGQVVGGSVYIVRIEGTRSVPVWDGKLHEVEMEEKLEHLPVWIRETVEERMN